MDSIWMAVRPTPGGAQLLAMQPPWEAIFKAKLRPNPSHPRALPFLLEALALWQGCKVRAALYADESPDGCATSLYRDLFTDPGDTPLYALDCVSVASKIECCRIEMIEGRDRGIDGVDGSKRVVVVLGLAKDVADDGVVSAQGAPQASGGPQDAAGTTADRGVVVRGRVVHERMLEHEGAFEREQSGGDDVEDDDLGSDEEAPELFDGHRFRAAARAVLGLGVCAKTSRKSFSSSRGSSRSAATASSSSARFMRMR